MMAVGEGPELGDAFGRALNDRQAGRPGVIVVERDDGLIEADFGDYLSGWSDGDTWALERAPGRCSIWARAPGAPPWCCKNAARTWSPSTLSLPELDQIAAPGGWRVTAAYPGAEYRAVLTHS